MTATLIARLAAATGPDRYLDALIWISTSGRSTTLDTAPAYTASIDAAVGLIKPMVGDWSWRVGNLPGGEAFCLLGTSRKEHTAATPPLAILMAVLENLGADKARYGTSSAP